MAVCKALVLSVLVGDALGLPLDLPGKVVRQTGTLSAEDEPVILVGVGSTPKRDGRAAQTRMIHASEDAPVKVVGIGSKQKIVQVVRADSNSESDSSVFSSPLTWILLLIFAGYFAQTEKGHEGREWTKMSLGKSAEDNKWVASAIEAPLVQQALAAMGLVEGAAAPDIPHSRSFIEEVELDNTHWSPITPEECNFSTPEECRKNAKEKLQMATAMSQEPVPMGREDLPTVDLLGMTDASPSCSPLLSKAMIDALAQEYEEDYEAESPFLKTIDAPLIFPTEDLLGGDEADEPLLFKTTPLIFPTEDDDY